MSNLTQLPIFRALLLTLVISGLCSIFIISEEGPSQFDPGNEPGNEAHAGNTQIAEQQRMIEALHLRVDRIEKTGVEQQIDALRAEMDYLRLHSTPDDTHFLPVTTDMVPIFEAEAPSEEVSVVQQFELRDGVIPEAIVVVQGRDPRPIVSVEVLDRYNRWVEVYSGPDVSVEPTSETWIECGSLAATENVRVEVMGKIGIEAVGVAVEDSVFWSMASN
jgi:hypothetical protein